MDIRPVCLIGNKLIYSYDQLSKDYMLSKTLKKVPSQHTCLPVASKDKSTVLLLPVTSEVLCSWIFFMIAQNVPTIGDHEVPHEGY